MDGTVSFAKRKGKTKMKRLMVVVAVALVALSSQAASFRWNASGIKDAGGENLYSGTASLYAYLQGSSADTAVLVDSATMTAGAIALKTFTDADHFEGGKTYNFYYTMTDENGAIFTSGLKPGLAQKSGTAMVAFGDSGAWAVPEPTSGLLLLLGVAGLALRRRRA